MLELFHFLVDYQIWIYVILGVLALVYLGKLISAWRERYATIFGLEREDAQRRLNSALAIFILLLLLIGAEFVLVTFVIPEWPLVMMTPVPTVTEVAEEDLTVINRQSGSSSGITIVATPDGAGAVNIPEAPSGRTTSGGCIPGQLEWLSPVSGDVISGSYTLEATVNVQDMAFYNWAFSRVEDQSTWQTLSAGNLPLVEGTLGLWATSQVANGDYVLRLTVYDLNNQELPSCDIYIRVLNDEN